jgi:hypothetical protein
MSCMYPSGPICLTQPKCIFMTDLSSFFVIYVEQITELSDRQIVRQTDRPSDRQTKRQDGCDRCSTWQPNNNISRHFFHSRNIRRAGKLVGRNNNSS